MSSRDSSGDRLLNKPQTIDETTTLLGTSTAQDATFPTSDAAMTEVDNREPQDKDKPLDFAQIAFLCYARLVEPVAFFSIFPFVNDMIKGFGVAEENCGFYSGLIVCLRRLMSVWWLLRLTSCLGIIVFYHADAVNDLMG